VTERPGLREHLLDSAANFDIAYKHGLSVRFDNIASSVIELTTMEESCGATVCDTVVVRRVVSFWRGSFLSL
jgi:hypothetical protein